LCVFQKPSAGIYILSRNRQNQLLVNITCQSTITVEGELLQKTGSGGLVSVKGSPVVGKKWYTFCMLSVLIEKFEDTKRVIRSCKSKKDRRPKMMLKTLHRKLKIKQNEPH
jgi:hypothetical protein